MLKNDPLKPEVGGEGAWALLEMTDALMILAQIPFPPTLLIFLHSWQLRSDFEFLGTSHFKTG